MSEADPSWSWYGAVGGAVVGAVLVLTLLVQNVLQGREITALEADVEVLKTSIVDARKSAGLSAVGALASAPSASKARPKRGAKARGDAGARGAAREGKARGGRKAEGGTKTAKAGRGSRGAPLEPSATP